MRYLLLFLFFILIADTPGYPQGKSTNEIRSAYLSFEKGRYEEALDYFRQKINEYPKDPLMNYYLGICMLNTDNNPLKALPYLRYASTQNVPDDIYLWLATLHHKLYDFEREQEFIERYESITNKQEQKEDNMELFKNRFLNTRSLLSIINLPYVTDKETIQCQAITDEINPDVKAGEFVTNPEFLKPYLDSLNESITLFIPQEVEWGEVLYFSMVSQVNGDKDIYGITKINDTLWSDVENVGNIINTEFDEDFPFMHYDGSTLFFASEGHYGIGGLDIYRSSWDWGEQKWSEPVNLGMPVNSPFNDFLFVPEPDRKETVFLSDREKNSGNVTKYRLQNKIQQIYYHPKSEVLKDIMLLSVSKNENVATVSIKEPVSEKDIRKKDLVREFKHRNEYDSILYMLSEKEEMADSLRSMMETKRNLYSTTQDIGEKRRLTYQILKMEENVFLLQDEIDELSAKIREIEQINLAENKTIYKASTQVAEPKNLKSEQTDRDRVRVVPETDEETVLHKLEKNKPDTTGLQKKNLPGLTKKPGYYRNPGDIPLNAEFPEGITYRIQLGAFSKLVSPSIFKGLYPIHAERKQGKSIIKYYAGSFEYYSDADKKLPLARNSGFKDAFIVAFQNGRRINPEEAKLLEGDRRFEIERNDASIERPFYMIQLMIPLTDTSNLAVLIDMAGDDYNLYKIGEKQNYLIKIGEFLKPDEAFELKDKIGSIMPYPVGVHAYFSKSELPVEEAKKINPSAEK